MRTTPSSQRKIVLPCEATWQEQGGPAPDTLWIVRDEKALLAQRALYWIRDR